MADRDKDTKFLKGAFILTLAGIVVKIIGAVYRIPLYSILGSEGMGLYQMAYPIYAILLTVSSAGLNVAISKAVAERWALGKKAEAKQVFRVSMVLMVVFGLLASLILYYSADFIAVKLGKDPRARLSVIAISPALAVVAVLSAFRGWFQGIERMEPTAISQVVEQIGRLLTMLVLARALLVRGIEYASSGASLGAAVGALVGVLYIGSVYLIGECKRYEPTGENLSFSSIAREIIRIAVPISLASAVFGITEFIDLALVPGRLQAAGFTPEAATSLYGKLTGAAFPLLNLPTVFTGALQVTLVPSISAALVLKDHASVRARVNKAMAITVMFGLPAAAGMFVLADPIPGLLYGDPGVGPILRVLSPALLFLAVQQVTAGILQGLGKLKVPLVNLVWAGLTKAAATYLLVGIPQIGVAGASVATVLHFGVAAVLNFLAIRKYCGDLGLRKPILKIVASTAIMSAIAYVSYYVAFQFLYWKLRVLLAIALGAFAYLGAVIFLRVVAFEDMAAIPGFGRIMSKFRK